MITGEDDNRFGDDDQCYEYNKKQEEDRENDLDGDVDGALEGDQEDDREDDYANNREDSRQRYAKERLVTARNDEPGPAAAI